MYDGTFMRKGLFQAMGAVAIAAMMLAGGWYWEVSKTKGGGSDVLGGGLGLPVPRTGAGGVFVLQFNDPVYTSSSWDYQLPLALTSIGGLDDVKSWLEMNPAELDFLGQNGMVGLSTPPPGKDPFMSFYDAYYWIKDNTELPQFITADSMLDAYHLAFESMLIGLEESSLRNETLNLTLALMLQSDIQRTQLPPEHCDLAELNVAFFAVAARLLNPDATVPAYVEERVDEVVSLIVAATGQAKVLGFHKEEDFTQYAPRGHYTRTEELQGYFKAMMWYGRRTFWGKYDDEMQRALLVSYALRENGAARAAYAKMSAVIDFIVGTPDDLTYQEVLGIADAEMDPPSIGYPGIFREDLLTIVQDKLKALRPPMIQSDFSLSGDWVWGLRVFGQRFVLDSYIFQNCVYSKVPMRYLPSGIDVMAALGSQEAWKREPIEEYAPALEAQLSALKDEVAGLDVGVWNQTLYWAWLHSLSALHQDTKGTGYPAFMGTDAWQAKELNTQLASWTQLTHDTMLYRKQSYTEDIGLSRNGGVYVEPVPELYSRMRDIVDATLDGLNELGFLTPTTEGRLTGLSQLLGSLERVSIAELTRSTPTPIDLSICSGAYDMMDARTTISDDSLVPRTVLVSDVHTDLNTNRCLEEGVGYVHLMVVAFPTEKGPVACVGAVFEHHEFAWPLSEGRLTDEEWMSMLKDGTAPAPAPWARDFMK